MDTSTSGARYHVSFRTICGREIQVGHLILGGAPHPAQRVSLGISAPSGTGDGAWGRAHRRRGPSARRRPAPAGSRVRCFPAAGLSHRGPRREPHRGITGWTAIRVMAPLGSTTPPAHNSRSAVRTVWPLTWYAGASTRTAGGVPLVEARRGGLATASPVCARGSRSGVHGLDLNGYRQARPDALGHHAVVLEQFQAPADPASVGCGDLRLDLHLNGADGHTAALVPCHRRGRPRAHSAHVDAGLTQAEQGTGRQGVAVVSSEKTTFSVRAGRHETD